MQVILAFCCKVASDTCICICEFIKEQRVEANQILFDLYAPSQCMLFLYMGSVHVFKFSICYHIAHNDFHLWHLQWPGSIRCLDELSRWWCFPAVCRTMHYVCGQWQCSVVSVASTRTTCGESSTYTAQQTPMYYLWRSTGTFSASGTGHHTPQQTLTSITSGQAVKELLQQ